MALAANQLESFNQYGQKNESVQYLEIVVPKKGEVSLPLNNYLPLDNSLELTEKGMPGELLAIITIRDRRSLVEYGLLSVDHSQSEDEFYKTAYPRGFTTFARGVLIQIYPQPIHHPGLLGVNENQVVTFGPDHWAAKHLYYPQPPRDPYSSRQRHYLAAEVCYTEDNQFEITNHLTGRHDSIKVSLGTELAT